MDCDGGTSIVNATDPGVQIMQSETVNNVVKMGNGNDNGNVGSEAGGSMRCYKRRKLSKICSMSKSLEDGDCSGETASKLADKCRNSRLDQIHWKMNGDDGGRQGCTSDAHIIREKDSDVCKEDRSERSPQSGGIPNCLGHAAKFATRILSGGTPNGIGHGAKVPTGNGAIEKSHSGANICWSAFRNILLSEKFSSLRKLLVGNFEGPDKLLNFSLINRRMDEGTYESSPTLFLSDIGQVWTKLEEIGAEMIFLAKSLSDISKGCFDAKVGGPTQFSSPGGKHEFGARASAFHKKTEQPESCGVHRDRMCKQCGQEVDRKDCPTWNSCKETSRVSCMDPSLEDIPPKGSGSCLEKSLEMVHEDCVICEKLAQNAGAVKHSTENGLQTSQISRISYLCKLCGTELRTGQKLKICDHTLCPNKYYHARCLTSKELIPCGPLWYCPSCLCRACLVDKDDDKIVLCDSCDQAYHLYCMNPPRTSIPRGKWFCARCDLNMQKIRRARMVFEQHENKIRKRGTMMQGSPRRKLDEEENPEKGTERMDILLNAALKYEGKITSNQASTTKS